MCYIIPSSFLLATVIEYVAQGDVDVTVNKSFFKKRLNITMAWNHQVIVMIAGADMGDLIASCALDRRGHQELLQGIPSLHILLHDDMS